MNLSDEGCGGPPEILIYYWFTIFEEKHSMSQNFDG